MPAIVPLGKPRLHSGELDDLLARHAPIDRDTYPFIVVGIRAYYRDTMGLPGRNDRNIYDDAIFIYSPNVLGAYNGNTDPSRVRKGAGTGPGKGMASLKPGVYYAHRFDLHNGKYLALCQRAGAVTVIRDGSPNYEDTGNHFGINIHRGLYDRTSSLGCQTIYPTQWDSFINLAVGEAKRCYGVDRWRKAVIPYVLLDKERI